MEKTSKWARNITAIICGGFLGTITRYLLGIIIQSYLGKSWPFDILFINISGTLILAFISTLADATFLVGPTRRLFINVGFMGAYTTFSSLALGDILLLTRGQWFLAVLYLLFSFAGGILAVLAGEWLGKELIKKRRRPVKETDTQRKFSGKLLSNLEESQL